MVCFDLVYFFTLGSSLLFLPPALLWGPGIPCALAPALTAPRARRLGRRLLGKEMQLQSKEPNPDTATTRTQPYRHGRSSRYSPPAPGPLPTPSPAASPGANTAENPRPRSRPRGEGRDEKGQGQREKGRLQGAGEPPRFGVSLAGQGGTSRDFRYLRKMRLDGAVLWSPGFPARTHPAGKHIFIYRERERVIFKNEIRTSDTNMFGILFFFSGFAL